MAITDSQLDSRGVGGSSPLHQDQLLPTALPSPVQAATDPLSLPDPGQVSVDITLDQAPAPSGLSWEVLDATVASLNVQGGQTTYQGGEGLDLVDYSALVDLDQLTGLLVADDPAQLSSSLLVGNGPPLLGEAFQADQLLVQRDGGAIDLLQSVEALRLGAGDDAVVLQHGQPATLWVDTGAGVDTALVRDGHAPLIEQWRGLEQLSWQALDPGGAPVHPPSVLGADHRFNILEDQAFSIALADLLPLDGQLQDVTLQPLSSASSDWLSVAEQPPDQSLMERLLIETRLRDGYGQPLSSDDLAALSPGSTVQADLLLSDTRAAGEGLIGMELNLQWDPAALSLQQVELDPSLPLFRSTGTLDAAAGRLSGLAAAALPRAGSGSVLGDVPRDRFATLSFTVGSVGAAGLQLQLTPTKLPTSRNSPLDPRQVLALGPDPASMAVIRGLARQSEVGEQRFLVDGLYLDGRHWQQQLTLNIQNVNDAPVALAAPALLALEDQPLQIDLSAWFSDDDLPLGDQLTYHLVGGQPDWLQLDLNSGMLTGLPDQAQVGLWPLQVEARDRSGASARQTLALTIEGVDDAPQWSGEVVPLIQLRQDRPFTITLPADLITDQDPGDVLTYSLDLQADSDAAPWLQLDAATGRLTGIAPSNLTDPFSVGLIATDSTGLSTRVPLQLQVVDQTFNRAPYLPGGGIQDLSVREGERISFDLPTLFRDDDTFIGDRLHFEVQAPSWLQFDPSTGRVSGLADNNAVGSHTVSFRAEDLDGAIAVSTFLITVDNVNQAPELLVPSHEGRLLQTGSRLALDLDNLFRDSDSIHGDWLNYSLRARSTSSLGFPDWLRWNSATGELSLSPGADDRGLLSLAFTATDTGGATTVYQLDLGIVSADGLVEVNQALQPLWLRPGALATVDIADAFHQLRGGGQLDYSFELWRRSNDGALTPVEGAGADWITLVDRQAQPVQREGRITIEPELRLQDGGALLRPEDLAGLQAGTALQLAIKVDDLRQATAHQGLIGLDLALDWSGLTLSPDNPADLRQAISSLFPLFRDVDLSGLGQQTLRLSAASLPALGVGDAIGDQPGEHFLTLNFLLNNPAQPVKIDLSLIGEQQGGVGLALADGSSGELLLNLLDLSTAPQFDLRLAPTAEDLGNYALRLWANDAGGDAVSQLVRVQVGSGMNSAPELLTAPQGFRLLDNVRQRLPLDRLFLDADGDQLTYSLQITADQPEQAQVLRQAIRLVQTERTTALDFTIPGLLEPVSGALVLVASDGALQTSQTIQLLLNPRSEVVPLYANPHHPSVRGGQAVGLSDLFAAPALRFNDSADSTELVVRSTQPIDLRLSPEYRRLSGLTTEQAAALEAGWRQASDPLEQTIPVSALAQVLDGASGAFDLNWLEVVAPSQPTSTVALDLASRATVGSDPQGTRFGLAQTDWQRAVLVTSPSAASPSVVTPASERYLASLLSSQGISLGSPATMAAMPLLASASLLAWRSQADFEAAIAGTLQDVGPVVALQVRALSQGGWALEPGQAEALYQLRDVRVLSRSDALFAGFDLSTALAPGLQVAAAWDPLRFTIVKAAGAAALADADPLRAGTQVALELDVSAAGLPHDYFNAYVKFVSADTLVAAEQQGLVLRDLDQRPITRAGWYDFTQRRDASGHPVGDGARFVVETINGVSRLSKILYTFTDNAFGDSNLNVGVIDDPGMPIRLVATLNPLQPATPPSGRDADSGTAPVPLSASPQPAADDRPPLSPEVTTPAPVLDPSAPAAGHGGAANSDANRVSPRASARGLAAANTIASGSDLPADASPSAGAASPTSIVDPAVVMNAAASGAQAADGSRAPLPDPMAPRSDRRPVHADDAASRGQPGDAADPGLVGDQHRWSVAGHWPDAIAGLFHQLAGLVGDESTLVGLMMGMLVMPGGVERSLRSLLLDSGLGRTIRLQRRNPDLEAQWVLPLRGGDGQLLHLEVRLEQGRLLLQQASPSAPAGDASPRLLEGDQGGTLWQLLGCISQPGALIEQLDRRLDQLLQAPLEESEVAWGVWLDQLAQQRQPAAGSTADAAVWEQFDALCRNVAAAREVDPGLADALMLMELLDCHVRLGGQLPWLSVPSVAESLGPQAKS